MLMDLLTAFAIGAVSYLWGFRRGYNSRDYRYVWECPVDGCEFRTSSNLEMVNKVIAEDHLTNHEEL